MFVPVFLMLAVLIAPVTATGQILVANEGPVVYGHHHLFASDIAAHRKFWVDTLGGTATTLPSGTEGIKFPNVFLLMRATKPSGGSKGTTANHIGFAVPDIRQVIAKVRANGFRMVTRDEVAANQAVNDDIAVLGTTSIAFVMGPDDTKVELVEQKAQKVPITLHHVHFFGQQNTEMRDWYVKVFGAKPRGGGGAFVSADLPGVALNFSPSPEPVVGTAGRAVDHIGFEIDNLAAFVKKLEADGIKITTSYRQIPKTDMWIAFITDPWGTSIELSEGLDKLP
jgi:catechol 2,3-dioxygenase-like lactoylglutathione lyase family enzyme